MSTRDIEAGLTETLEADMGWNGFEFALLLFALGTIKQRLVPPRAADSVHQPTTRAQRSGLV
jgi:hypothetical protein